MKNIMRSISFLSIILLFLMSCLPSTIVNADSMSFENTDIVEDSNLVEERISSIEAEELGSIEDDVIQDEDVQAEEDDLFEEEIDSESEKDEDSDFTSENTNDEKSKALDNNDNLQDQPKESFLKEGQPNNSIKNKSSGFGLGYRGERVVVLKKNLSHLGIGNYPTNPSNYFGDSTERNVKTFQRYYGIPITGEADPATLAKIDAILSSNYQDGKSGNHIVVLKRNLSRLGIGNYPSNPSPRYGGSTERNVRTFQEKYDLLVNGIADDITLTKIQSLLDVITLKQNLSRLGIGNYPKNPSPNYGGATQRNVKTFQRYYSVPVTGEADSTTLTKIDAILSSSYQDGKSGDHVAVLKRNLSRLGIGNYPSNPSPRYGGSTERNVRTFQEKYDLLVNGIADDVTLTKIQSLLDVITLKQNLSRLGIGNYPKNPSPNYGGSTQRNVKTFQRYYSVLVTGEADPATLDKIDTILSSNYQEGKSGDHVVVLKRNLSRLGIGNYPSNPSPRYGGSTDRNVRTFQKKYSLLVNGIADPVTLAKIDELLQEDEEREKITYTNYNITFTEALNIQMTKSPQTDKYSNQPGYISADFVELAQHAVIYSTGNVNLRTEPIIDPENIVTSVPNGTKIEVLDEVEGAAVNGNTKWYKIEYGKHKELYVHSGLVRLNALTATTTANLNVRSEPTASSHSYGLLAKGTSVTVQEQLGDWLRINYQTWRNATRSDVEQYLNPENNNRFQHLLLSSSVGVNASEINKILKGQGILAGLGQAFIEGGRTHQVNEIYLISHAFLETGRGTSKLSTGVEVGKTKSGDLVLVDSENRKDLVEIKIVYNMFGIGAVDNNALQGGAFRAYREGWFTPAAAIKGGAKFVGQNYIHSSHKQDTLYKMRWNPANPGVHQYATDMAWAVKQVSTIENLYGQLNNPTMHFDIPVYK